MHATHAHHPSIHPCPTWVYVKHHGSRLTLPYSSLSLIPHAFAKYTWKESSAHRTFPLKSTTTTRTKFPNGNQEPTAISAKVETTCEEQGRQRLRNPEQERQIDCLWREILATKKSPKNTWALPIQNECNKDLTGFEDWWGVAQTLRGEGKEAKQNCAAVRDRQIGGKLAQVW